MTDAPRPATLTKPPTKSLRSAAAIRARCGGVSTKAALPWRDIEEGEMTGSATKASWQSE